MDLSLEASNARHLGGGRGTTAGAVNACAIGINSLGLKTATSVRSFSRIESPNMFNAVLRLAALLLKWDANEKILMAENLCLRHK